ncbi:MAG: aldehyde dehydrogenase family protein [Acidimicrobiia bacterium]|nr:aldehyde dehydrogenase family protein [Acidimicrobiia bacterium]
MSQPAPLRPPDPDVDYRLLIGGDWVAASGGTTPVVNPATEAVVGHAPEATVADVEAAVDAAAAAFPRWAATDVSERCALLARAADLLDERMADLVPLVQAETGATLRVTKQMQVPMAAVRFRRYARGVEAELTAPEAPVAMPATALAPGGLIGGVARRAPVGVVAAITSYNFPLTNMAGKLAPALAMGNTVVVKPAPQDPLGVVRMGEVFAEAGFPPGVVNVVCTTDVAAAEALVAADGIDMVSFTGSTAVGRRIGEVAGGSMTRLLLELGGKGAAIVFDDAALSTAVAAISSTWAFHSGQICTAPTRVLVHRSRQDELLAALGAAAERLTVGDPLERSTVVGPVISEVHRNRIEAAVRAGRDDGAEVAVGGTRPDMDTGWYVAPTLLAGCRADMDVVRTELFGPVVVVVPFDDEDEAVALANASEFGLYDYVFSADTSRAYRVATALRTGNVGVNTAQRHHELPFGGFKQSGVGRDGGRYGLHAYSELQSIVWPG